MKSGDKNKQTNKSTNKRKTIEKLERLPVRLLPFIQWSSDRRHEPVAETVTHTHTHTHVLSVSLSLFSSVPLFGLSLSARVSLLCIYFSCVRYSPLSVSASVQSNTFVLTNATRSAFHSVPVRFPCGSRAVPVRFRFGSAIRSAPASATRSAFHSVPVRFPCGSRAVPVRFPCGSRAVPVRFRHPVDWTRPNRTKRDAHWNSADPSMQSSSSSLRS